MWHVRIKPKSYQIVFPKVHPHLFLDERVALIIATEKCIHFPSGEVEHLHYVKTLLDLLHDSLWPKVTLNLVHHTFTDHVGCAFAFRGQGFKRWMTPNSFSSKPSKWDNPFPSNNPPPLPCTWSNTNLLIFTIIISIHWMQEH